MPLETKFCQVAAALMSTVTLVPAHMGELGSTCAACAMVGVLAMLIYQRRTVVTLHLSVSRVRLAIPLALLATENTWGFERIGNAHWHRQTRTRVRRRRGRLCLPRLLTQLFLNYPMALSCLLLLTTVALSSMSSLALSLTLLSLPLISTCLLKSISQC